MKVRGIALSLLNEWEADGKYINLTLSSHRTDNLLPGERAFLTALLYGCAERRITLDHFIGTLASRSAESLDINTRSLLRMGLYQIYYMKDIPDHAAVNETVSLSRNAGERGFVNAVLRAACRIGAEELLPARAKSAVRYLSVAYSVSQYIVRTLVSEFGEERCESILRTLSREAPLCLSVNILKESRDEYMRELSDAGIDFEPTESSPIGVRIFSHIPVRDLPGYGDGRFYVQDEASFLSVLALSPTEGERVADVCSAPGGKSFAAAMLMNGKGEIRAFDLHSSKLPRIPSGADRLGVGIISAEERDSRFAAPELIGTFDAVICDVPCSGLGVMAKKPEIRYKTAEDVSGLPELQYSILEASAEYLRPGGRLVYSTCTLPRRENREVVERFLARHPGFEAEDFRVGRFASEDGSLLLLPDESGTDGFFISRIRKRHDQ